MGITLAHLKEAVDRLLDRIALVAQTASKSIEEMGKTKADKVNIPSRPAAGRATALRDVRIIWTSRCPA